MKSDDTLTTICYNQIRDLILTGELAPGERLKGSYLKSKLGIGLTPIREALSRLVSTNLVIFKDKTGFSVAYLYEEKIIDTFKAFAKIETILLKESIQNGDDNWEAAVLSAQYKITKIDINSIAKYFIYSLKIEEFHNALISACNCYSLHQIRKQLMIIRRWYCHLAYQVDKTICIDRYEYSKLSKLALQRKTNLACSYLYTHLTKDIKIIVNKLKPYGLINH